MRRAFYYNAGLGSAPRLWRVVGLSRDHCQGEVELAGTAIFGAGDADEDEPHGLAERAAAWARNTVTDRPSRAPVARRTPAAISRAQGDETALRGERLRRYPRSFTLSALS